MRKSVRVCSVSGPCVVSVGCDSIYQRGITSLVWNVYSIDNECIIWISEAAGTVMEWIERSRDTGANEFNFTDNLRFSPGILIAFDVCFI